VGPVGRCGRCVVAERGGSNQVVADEGVVVIGRDVFSFGRGGTAHPGQLLRMGREGRQVQREGRGDVETGLAGFARRVDPDRDSHFRGRQRIDWDAKFVRKTGTDRRRRGQVVAWLKDAKRDQFCRLATDDLGAVCT
jgi:hypothetical protein